MPKECPNMGDTSSLSSKLLVWRPSKLSLHVRPQCCGLWFTLHGVVSGGTCKRLHCGRKDEKCWWILVVGLYLHYEYNLDDPLTAPTLLSQCVNVFYICVVSWTVTPRAYMTYNTNTALPYFIRF